MRHRSSLAGLLVSVLLSGCVSAPEAPGVAVARPGRATLPPSALGGVVRALETVDALPLAGALTEVRALECDSCVDSTHGREFARVFLDVTVFADTSARARAAFEELRGALEAAARATTGSALVDEARMTRAFAVLGRTRHGDEELVSYTERLRLEVEPADAPTVALTPQVEQTLPNEPFETYVRECAAPSVGMVSIQPGHPTRPRPAGLGSYRIAPAFDFARFTCADIASFLCSLEAGSPAMRLTRVQIERSQHEPDPQNPRGWTFEAELSARSTAPMSK